MREIITGIKDDKEKEPYKVTQSGGCLTEEPRSEAANRRPGERRKETSPLYLQKAPGEKCDGEEGEVSCSRKRWR